MNIMIMVLLIAPGMISSDAEPEGAAVHDSLNLIYTTYSEGVSGVCVCVCVFVRACVCACVLARKVCMRASLRANL